MLTGKALATCITPIIKPFVVTGRLIYNEALRARSIIRLNRRFLDEFSQLQSNKEWTYRLEFWRSTEKTIRRLQEAQKTGEGVPVLLYIYPEEISR